MTILAICVLATGSVAAGDAAKIQDPPWHLVDVWWRLGDTGSFESLALDVEVSSKVDDDVMLYIAPVGGARINQTPFYGGIQTNFFSRSKKDPRGKWYGRGVIFSRWGERSYDAIRPATGGLCDSSGHEGDFIGVRRKYAWQEGRYTFSIQKMDRQELDGRPHTWVGAFIYSHDLDEQEFIGALRFEGDELKLSGQIASFVEIYGKRIPLEKIPETTVTLGNLRVNGQRIKDLHARALYPAGVPDYAEATAVKRQVVIKTGKLQDRQRREEQLF